MSKFEIEGEEVIEKTVSPWGIIYGFKRYAGRRVKVVILAEDKKEGER